MSDRAPATPAGAGRLFDDKGPADSVEALLSVATDGRRRSALVALRDDGPLTVPDLAARVASGERTPEAASEEEHRRTTTALHHSHLPRLADAGLIELERENGHIVVRPDDGLASDALETVVDLARRDGGEDVIAILADPTRRRVVRAVRSANGAIALDDLAESIAEEDGADRDGEAIQSARVALHHVHLPRLEASGVVEYDPDERRVAPGEGSESLLEQVVG